MAKIDVLIVVPGEYSPPDESDCNTWMQYLTLRLVDYFPRLIEEILDEIPYLSDLDISREDIEADYESGTAVSVRNGFWIIVQVNKKAPGTQQPTVTLRTELQLVILRWFRSKDVGEVRMSLDVEWRDP